MEFQKALETFHAEIEKMKAFGYAGAMVYWDLSTGAAHLAPQTRSKALGTLSAVRHEIMLSDETKEVMAVLEANKDQLSDIDRMQVEEVRRTIDKIEKIPTKEFREYVELTTKSQMVWEKAKHANDWASFAPYLEKIITFKRKFADYMGWEDHPYNAHLDDFERGMTVTKLDDFFATLKKTIVPLVHQIKASQTAIDDDFLYLNYPTDKQAAFSNHVLESIGFDLSKGMLKESEHPFTMGLCINDVRLTTHYYPEHVTSAIFSTIHEGGHGIYEQNFDEKLDGTVLADGTTAGIHESQSRLYENNIGRSLAFWIKFYPMLQKDFKKQLDGVSVDMFHRAINVSRPSFIRVEADELTYSLHIMVRYEIEKGLMEGKYEVENLPQIWNTKMEEYLGITPPDDKHGVLQDVHWSDGLFGYFPSYALGNAYAAQIDAKMRGDLDVDSLVEAGDFDPIRAWLTERVHQYGLTKRAEEIIEIATGEALNPDYYAQYLTKKYTDIYQL